jgi:hypothetical protein
MIGTKFSLDTYREFRKENSHIGKMRFLTLVNRHFKFYQEYSLDMSTRKQLADMFPSNADILDILKALRKGVDK